MSQRFVIPSEREELWKWIQRPPPPWDPAPDWVVKVIDDPAILLKYAEDSIVLRTKTLELELEKLQAMKDLIASLPGPLP